MPFDFKAFDAKCMNMSVDELQREWEHYTRLISGSATSTAVSGAAIPFTLGVSVIGVGLAAPAIHNARKKREIIERHLNRHGTTHHTRKRDVLTPMAISGTVGVVTLGVGGAGADVITSAAAEHGISAVAANEIAVKATTHLAVDGIAVLGEEHHMKQKKAQEAWKAHLIQQSANGKVPVPVAATIPTNGPYNPQGYGQQPIPTPVYYPSAGVDNKLPYLAVPPPPASISRPTTPSTPAPPYSALEGVPIQPVVASKPGDVSYFNIPPPPPPPTSTISEKFGMGNQTLQFAPPPTASQANQAFLPPPSPNTSTASPPPPATPSFSWMGDVKRPLQDFTPAAPPEQAQYLHNAAQHPVQNFYGNTVQQTPQLAYPSYPGTTMTTAQGAPSDQLANSMQNLQLNQVVSPSHPYNQPDFNHGLPSPAPSHATQMSMSSPAISSYAPGTNYFSPQPVNVIPTSACVAPAILNYSGSPLNHATQSYMPNVQGYPTPAQTPGLANMQSHYTPCAPSSGQNFQHQPPFGVNPLPTPGLTPQSEMMPYFPPPPKTPQPV